MKCEIGKFPGNYMFRFWDEGNFHSYLGNFSCKSAIIGYHGNLFGDVLEEEEEEEKTAE